MTVSRALDRLNRNYRVESLKYAVSICTHYSYAKFHLCNLLKKHDQRGLL